MVKFQWQRIIPDLKIFYPSAQPLTNVKLRVDVQKIQQSKQRDIRVTSKEWEISSKE